MGKYEIKNINEAKESVEVHYTIALDKYDIGAVHDAIYEATDCLPSFQDCIQFLQNHKKILSRIVSIGEIETEVRDEIYVKVKENMKKYGNFLGKGD